jgi:restriction system protein
MRMYYRLMLGKGGVFSEECFNGSFIGADFISEVDLSEDLRIITDWRDFNAKYRSVWLKQYPEKAMVAAGLACGMLWTVSKGIKIGDLVLCPDGHGSYLVGEVTGDYNFVQGEILPHRRSVKWYPGTIERSNMSIALRNSTGFGGTVSDITKYTEELEQLIKGKGIPTLISSDETIEDPSIFALEQHLEDFLVENWSSTVLSKDYDIYEQDGELLGQQFPSDTGPMDILAISKDKKTFLVIELKKGRASDSVVGQVQRYMGYVKDELAEENQNVKGVIIAFEDDKRIKRALSVTNNIDFYCYKVDFKLIKS